MLVCLCVFVCVWGGICPPRLRPSMNSGWLSHLLVKSPWWTKIGAVTNHDVMHRLGLIVVIPLLNRLPGILFRGSPPLGHQKSKISCSPAEEMHRKELRIGAWVKVLINSLKLRRYKRSFSLSQTKSAPPVSRFSTQVIHKSCSVTGKFFL